MKMTLSKDILFRSSPLAAFCACALLAGATPLFAGDAKAPVTTEEPSFSNWVETGVSGATYSGNRGQGQQRTGVSQGISGGINDMHLEQTLGNKWFAKLDGRAIAGSNDYDLKLDISKTDVGYLRAGYKEFRTYYNEMGGFYPNSTLPGGGRIIPPYDDPLHIDRGDIWAELGLRMPNLPEITFRYDHITREGQKDSTIWGDTALTGANLYSNNTRRIVPAFRDINEKRDVFTADVKQTFGNTDVGLGGRADLISNNDSLNTISRPGEYNPNVLYKDSKIEKYVTQEDTLKSDTFNTHATTETRFGEKLWLTSAYSFDTANTNTGGSRIYGPNFNSPFLPIFGVSSATNAFNTALPIAATSAGSSLVGNVPAARAATGYINLLGGSELKRNEFNVNLMWIPLPQVSVIAGIRFDESDTNSLSGLTQTQSQTAAHFLLPYYVGRTLKTGTVTYIQPTTTPYVQTSDYELEKWAESLEVRYTGLKDWVLYTRCDLDEDTENVTQFQNSAAPVWVTQYDSVSRKVVNMYQVPGSFGVPAINETWQDTRLTQKYTEGFNWYPLRALSFSGQYYHKSDANDYDYGPKTNSAIFNTQHFNTDDVNFRITARPFSTLSLVSRYDFQRTDIYTDAADAPAGNGSANITNHMFGECITWNPLDRLYLQASGDYVLNKTNTAAAITIMDPTIFIVDNTGTKVAPAYVAGLPVSGPVGFSFKNNYWTASFGAGFILDEKTDLHADYTYYRADDYSPSDLTSHGVVLSQPYGAGQEEHTVSASVQRQLCRNARLTLKYAYITSRDETSGGYGNFNAHQISTSVMVRF